MRADELKRTEALAAISRPDRYPRSTRYDLDWLLDLEMGPNPLAQLEDLIQDVPLRSGQRVLDLGSGRGATSVFLVREFDVDVVAADLWVDPDLARRTFADVGLDDRITAIQADARSLPFAEREFDAIVSIDAFEYFGTDVHLLPSLLRVLRPGGRIGMTTPALRADPYVHDIPVAVAGLVGSDAAAWHAPAWWRRHWELSCGVEHIVARWQEGGLDDWLRWHRALLARSAVESDEVLEMLQADLDEQLGFALVSATKRA